MSDPRAPAGRGAAPAARPANRADRARRAARLLAGGVSLGLVAVALGYGLVRLLRPDTVFQYTEGPVLGSLVAFRDGGLAALYPADGWSTPPLVLTLYTPLFFWLSVGADALLGSPAALVAPRAVGLVAGAVALAAPAAVAARRGAGWEWTALLLGAAAIAPPAFNLMGGAQVDLPALAFALGGVLVLLPAEEGAAGGAGSRTHPAREAAALLLFLLAFFTKQSFVAAPAAVALARWAAGRRASAALFLAVWVLLAGAGLLLLERASGGGFSANAFGALRGATGPEGFRLALARSAPWLWGPLVLLVLAAAGSRLRPGLPEMYAGLTWLLHLAGLWRAGASVNYLAEPLFAVALVGVVRAPDGRRGDVFPPGAAVGVRRVAGTLLAAWIVAVGAALGAGRAIGVLRVATTEAGFSIRGWRGGHPLTEVAPFPAILREGGRPYLNDPFAFGVLLDAGVWDPGRLAADLRAGSVPFVLTSVDLGLGPAPPELGARELLFGYLWLAPPVWRPITEAYERVGDGPPWVWLPRRARRPGREEGG